MALNKEDEVHENVLAMYRTEGLDLYLAGQVFRQSSSPSPIELPVLVDDDTALTV